jgi:cobalt-zinc-cadmium efflux system outer membrane protein
MTAAVASARADAAEAQAQLALDRARSQSKRDAAACKRRRGAGRSWQQPSAGRRWPRDARLLREVVPAGRDRPARPGCASRPRPAEAERQAARTRIELAAAISAWRQALGLLPQ